MDRLLKKLHGEHKAIWESLGSPNGWYWYPDGGFRNPFNMLYFKSDWLESDPEWIDCDPEIKRLFYKVRAGTTQWNRIAMPAMLVLAILFFGAIKLSLIK